MPDLRKAVRDIATETARKAVGSEQHLTTRDRLARGGSVPGTFTPTTGGGAPGTGTFTIGTSTIAGTDRIA